MRAKGDQAPVFPDWERVREWERIQPGRVGLSCFECGASVICKWSAAAFVSVETKRVACMHSLGPEA